MGAELVCAEELRENKENEHPVRLSVIHKRCIKSITPVSDALIFSYNSTHGLQRKHNYVTKFVDRSGHTWDREHIRTSHDTRLKSCQQKGPGDTD